jgi:MFS family permease
MGVLALVRLSAQLDLGILSLLVEPIKHDLHLSDGQIGLLLGFAFAVFHLGIGIPLAALVDRFSRRAILAAGVTIWSLMTALTGVAQNFGQLFTFRAGVGAGESVNGPATYSLIADLFPREKLPRAIAVLNLGSMAGLGLSMVLGAVVIHALSTMTMPTLPLIGQMRHWQVVFVLVGAPGLLLALLMMSVTEPPRRGAHGRAAMGVSAATLRECVAYLVSNWRYFLPMFLGLAISAIESGGTNMWRPAFFQRSYGWTPQQAGLATGVAQLVAAPIGLFFGAWLSERIARRRDDANLRVVCVGWGLAIPFAVMGPLMPTPQLAVLASGLAIFGSMIGTPTQNAALQSVTPNHMRGRITALYLLTYVLAGQGIGPSFIAAVTELGFRDEASLRYSLAASAAIMMPLALVIMASGVRAYGREIHRLKSLD